MLASCHEVWGSWQEAGFPFWISNCDICSSLRSGRTCRQRTWWTRSWNASSNFPSSPHRRFVVLWLHIKQCLLIHVTSSVGYVLRTLGWPFSSFGKWMTLESGSLGLDCMVKCSFFLERAGRSKGALDDSGDTDYFDDVQVCSWTKLHMGLGQTYTACLLVPSACCFLVKWWMEIDSKHCLPGKTLNACYKTLTLHNRNTKR